jgi:hypothetical protein
VTRHRNGHRPYARKRNGPPSVTTILDAMATPGLEWGSAKETALFAVHHQDEWTHLDPDVAVNKLRRHFRGVWDGRADVGTAVHHINEAWTWGEDADVPPELVGYVDGLERFWRDFQPETVATEEVVRYPDGNLSYIGQRDWVADLGGDRWLLDIKTTAQQDADKGVYPDSWRLQLAAYRWATEIVLYDEKNKEVGTVPNYPVDRCGVIHLRGDGDYTLYELQAGKAEWERFLQLRRVWTWVNKEASVPAPAPVLAPTDLTVTLTDTNREGAA